MDDDAYEAAEPGTAPDSLNRVWLGCVPYAEDNWFTPPVCARVRVNSPSGRRGGSVGEPRERGAVRGELWLWARL